MPGLWGRFSTLIKSKVSKLLDRAEDPAETLDYSYEKQLELVQNVKRGIADVVTSKKRLQLQEESLRQQAEKLDGQARQALGAGNEELARTALQRKQAIETEVGSLDHQVGELESPTGAADCQRAEAADQDGGVPVKERGHQGAVLRGGGAGADLRGRDGGRGADGGCRPRDAARDGQDREHEGAC